MNKILSLLLLFSTIAIANACDLYCGNSAVLNKSVGRIGSVNETAFFFDNNYFSPSIYWTHDCSLQVSVNGGNITITGVVYAFNDASTGFFINLQSSQSSSLSGVQELQPQAYKVNGGPIDPTTWTFYQLNRGALTGFGAYKDVLLTLSQTMHPLQVGYGANGKNYNFGLSAWYDFTGPDGQTHQGDINIDLNCKEVICDPSWNITAAVNGQSFSYTNANNQQTSSFTFVDPTGLLVEDASLTSAVLGGSITGFGGSNEVCALAIIATRLLTYNTPHQQLPASSYVANGGTIDPTTWRFYAAASASITCASSTTVLSVYEGIAIQIGYGANGNNFNFGASGFFDFNVTVNGKITETGIINFSIDLICGPLPPVTAAPVTPAPVTAAPVTPTPVTAAPVTHAPVTSAPITSAPTPATSAPTPATSAPTPVTSAPVPPPTCNVYCAYDAVLNKSIGPSGSVEASAYYFDSNEFPPSVYNAQPGQCGLKAAISGDTLTITGTVYAADPSTGFFINIQATQTFNQQSFLQLDSSVYVANGGYVNPATWLYYNLNTGSLTGFGAYAGVTLPLTQTMHSLQLGAGANGKNINYGISAWFDYQYDGQTLQSDINVDLVCAAIPTAAPTAEPTTVPTSAPIPATSAPVTSAPTPATSAPIPATSAPVTSAPTPATSAPTPATPAPSSSGSGSSTSASSSGSGSTTSSGTTDGSTTGTSSDDNSCPPNPFVAQQAIADQYGGYSYFAFIFNTTTNVQYRFNFVNNAGSFQIYSNGSAELTGTLSPLSSNPDDGLFSFYFDADFLFNSGSRPAEYLEELKPSAYVPEGPVNPDTWRFFSVASANATISTSGYSLNIVPFMDMQFQVGAGANGKNINYGASAWFYFYLIDNSNSNLVAEGVLDVDVDLVCNGSGTTNSGSNEASGSGVGITGGQVNPSSAPSTPATTATTASASTLSLSMSMLFLVVAIVLNL